MHRYQMYYLSCYGKSWVQFNFLIHYMSHLLLRPQLLKRWIAP